MNFRLLGYELVAIACDATSAVAGREMARLRPMPSFGREAEREEIPELLESAASTLRANGRSSVIFFEAWIAFGIPGDAMVLRPHCGDAVCQIIILRISR